MNLLESCSECYKFSLSQYPDSIQIVGGLDANTDYYIWITDKFNNIFCTDAIETDADGSITIDGTNITNLPTGLFCKDAGDFKFEAKAVDVYYSGITQFTFSGVNYDCIWVSFLFNNSPVNVIL